MTAPLANLLARADAEGVLMWPNGAAIEYRSPGGRLSPEIRALILANKPALLAALAAWDGAEAVRLMSRADAAVERSGVRGSDECIADQAARCVAAQLARDMPGVRAACALIEARVRKLAADPNREVPGPPPVPTVDPCDQPNPTRPTPPSGEPDVPTLDSQHTTPNAPASSSSLTFEQLAAMEPRLLALRRDLEARAAYGSRKWWCANAAWFGYGRFAGLSCREGLPRLVGWYRKPDQAHPHDAVLRSEEAYCCAYDALYGSLPHCRRCGCA